MGKSLTDAAKSVLMKEGAIPSVSASDNNPDRDIKKSTPNAATLKPGSKYKEADPKHNEAKDLGPALVTPTGESGPAKAGDGVGKDTSKSSKSSVAAEPMHKLSEEEELDEDVEISEELAEFISNMLDEGFDEEAIAQAIEENFELVEECDDDKKDKKDDDGDDDDKDDDKDSDDDDVNKDEKKSLDDAKEKSKALFKEDMDALLEGEELSEDFRTKAETIFESAVTLRVDERVEAIKEEYNAKLAEEVEKITASLKEDVNDFMNYVVEQWVVDNEVAIEAGLRTEITEEFIGGLRNLFAENFIDIPESKVNIVEELGAELEEVKAKLNEEIERNVEITKAINEANQHAIVAEACEGLTTTEAEKLKALAENVEFKSTEEFEAKVATLKESYFPASKPVRVARSLDGEPSIEPTAVLTEDRMNRYVKAIGKTQSK